MCLGDPYDSWQFYMFRRNRVVVVVGAVAGNYVGKVHSENVFLGTTKEVDEVWANPQPLHITYFASWWLLVLWSLENVCHVFIYL